MGKSISPKVGAVIIGVVVVVAIVVGYKATTGGSKVTAPQSMSNFMGKDKAAPPNLQGAGRPHP
ncbi:MAG: hypothetical protein ABJA67_02295 [Chthonomonadales bacterium]